MQRQRELVFEPELVQVELVVVLVVLGVLALPQLRKYESVDELNWPVNE